MSETEGKKNSTLFHKIISYSVYVTIALNISLCVTCIIDYLEIPFDDVRLNNKVVLIIAITSLIFCVLIGGLIIYTTIKGYEKMHKWLSYLAYVALPLNLALSVPSIYNYAKTPKIDRNTNDTVLITLSSISLVTSSFTIGFATYVHFA